MNYRVLVLPSFSLNLKKLAKKYKNIKIDLQNLTKKLSDNPKLGILLHSNCYKLRIANSSIKKGKSGGFRVIYYFLDKHNNIYLMSIYSKKQKNNISESELLKLLEMSGIKDYLQE